MTQRSPFIILLIALAVYIGGCTILGRRNLPPECDPQLQALLLTTDDFPPGWSRGIPIQDDEFREGAIESCLVSFYILNGGAGQIVNEYQDEPQAIRGYTNLISYSSWEKSSQTLTPPVYVGSTADEYILECAIPEDRPMCQYISRYGRFVTRFNTHFLPDYLTEDEFVMILQAVDSRMK